MERLNVRMYVQMRYIPRKDDIRQRNVIQREIERERDSLAARADNRSGCATNITHNLARLCIYLRNLTISLVSSNDDEIDEDLIYFTV